MYEGKEYIFIVFVFTGMLEVNWLCICENYDDSHFHFAPYSVDHLGEKWYGLVFALGNSHG